MQTTNSAKTHEALSVRYNRFKDNLSGQKPAEHLFDTFTNDRLFDPEQWLQAFVLWEYAWKNEWNKTKTVNFFRKIFYDYDGYFEFDLNDDDYDWYWSRISTLLDAFGEYHPEGWNQLATQYLVARESRKDTEKTVVYLEKACTANYEPALIKYGEFLYRGTVVPQNKERAEELFSLVKSKTGLEELQVVRAFNELWEGDIEIARKILTDLETDPDENNLPDIYYLHAYIADIDKKYEEAKEFYIKRISLLPHDYIYYRLAYLYANNLTENAGGTGEILELLEKSFKIDPTRRAAEGLYHYYYESGTEWQDNDKIIYLLRQGAKYGIGYCSYQLAWILLNNENYKDIDNGLKFLDKAITEGYHNAYLTKAVYYRDGNILEKDIPKCMQILEKAVEIGCYYAWHHLGYLYEKGFATGDNTPNYPKALEYYLLAAEKGEIESCEHAGEYLRNGYAGDKDPVKAREYYEKAISLGSNFARVELGIMSIDGDGEPADHAKSFTLFSEAAANNYSPGHYYLGLAYRKSWGTPENPDKAFEHLQIAAEAGHIWAQSELAMCYQNGYGVEKDRAKALEYMLQAAEKKLPFAQYKVGEYYMYGNDKVAVNYDEALKWLTLAAENNYPYANLELGNYYFYRYNKTNEPEKSYEFYQKAARGGYVNEGLGLCLQWGYGVEKNEGEGFKYLLKSAEDGYIRAMFYTGRCYLYGIGIQENHDEAFRWFNQAAGYNHLSSLYFKGRMLVEGDGTPPDIEEGVECVKRAAEGGNRDAMYELANYYLLGKGVEANDDTAWDWFEKAAAKGHKESMKITGKSQRK